MLIRADNSVLLVQLACVTVLTPILLIKRLNLGNWQAFNDFKQNSPEG